MEWKGGNKTLKEHKEKGKRVLFFTHKDQPVGDVVYQGEVQLIGVDYPQQPDEIGHMRYACHVPVQRELL